MEGQTCSEEINPIEPHQPRRCLEHPRHASVLRPSGRTGAHREAAPSAGGRGRLREVPPEGGGGGAMLFVVPIPRRGGPRAGAERSVPRRAECGGTAVQVSSEPAPPGPHPPHPPQDPAEPPRFRDARLPLGSRCRAAAAGGPESMAAAPAAAVCPAAPRRG